MTDDELSARADANFAAMMRLPAVESCAVAGAVMAASATRFAYGPFNAVVGGGAGAVGGELLDRARAWFGERGRGFTVYVRGERDPALLARCRDERLIAAGELPGMALDAPPAPVAGVEIVDGDAAARDFVAALSAAWVTTGMQPATMHKHLGETAARLRTPATGLVLARDAAGVAQATALAFLSDEIGGLYWVSTRPEARGRGLGTAVTAAAARWAFDRGARAVILQASPQGEPVYRRMGFREMKRYPWFVATR